MINYRGRSGGYRQNGKASRCLLKLSYRKKSLLRWCKGQILLVEYRSLPGCFLKAFLISIEGLCCLFAEVLSRLKNLIATHKNDRSVLWKEVKKRCFAWSRMPGTIETRDQAAFLQSANGPLRTRIEFPEGIDLLTEKLDPDGVLTGKREYVEDAAPLSNFTRYADKVDTFETLG
jgi:hypothetical protein